MTKLEELEKRIQKLEGVIIEPVEIAVSKREPSVFVPKNGDRYWYLCSYGTIGKVELTLSTRSNLKYSLFIGRTKETCETFKKVHDRYHELMEGVELDWGTDKLLMVYDHHNDYIYYGTTNTAQTSGTLYMNKITYWKLKEEFTTE